jgi:cytochrome c peroxidase
MFALDRAQREQRTIVIVHLLSHNMLTYRAELDTQGSTLSPMSRLSDAAFADYLLAQWASRLFRYMSGDDASQRPSLGLGLSCVHHQTGCHMCHKLRPR